MARIATERGAVQKPLLKYAEKAGWQYIAPDRALTLRGGEQGKFFHDCLKQLLVKLNADFLDEQKAQEIIRKLEAIPDNLEGNKQILDWLRGEKTFHDDADRRDRNVTLIDFANIENNDFMVTEEWAQASTGISGKTNRCDVIFLINGIPLAIVENKSPAKTDAMEDALNQLKRYERETPEMIACPQVFNITHLIEYFYGATWNYSRKNIFNWKKELGDRRDKEISLEEAVTSFFNREKFLSLIKEWILFFYKDNELQKTVLKQHQTRAIEKIIARCEEYNKNRGLIWHTQGSGKTFTMITAARILLEKYPYATVMMVIDRNELEGQLEGWIESLVGKQQGSSQTVPIKRATTKSELQELLYADFSGLIISMIHKFDEIAANSCTREDFYILIDEAHRSVNKGLGNYLMAALPNATLFGFTGTPIDNTAAGKGTFKIFGRQDQKGYLDKYSIRESIDDGTTLKLNHVSAPSKIRLSSELLETEFLKLADSEGVSDIDDLNKVLQRAVKLKAFLKTDKRVAKVAEHIKKHFTENVQPSGYKAFLVAVDREACVLYKEALDELLSAECSQIVYSAGHNDAEGLARYHITDDEEKQIIKNFKKEGCDPQILIVTDKLITGFDAPILYCMYLDKPMRDHILLQAIARVNRPYEDKQGRSKSRGVIVDFIGIFQAMQKALSFDSDEVNAIIEDLDLLVERFGVMIEKDFAYLPLSAPPKQLDKFIEKLICEDFRDPEEREKFIRQVKELEMIYEVISPNAKLHPYLQNYQKIIEIRKMVRNTYDRNASPSSDLAKKTEKLIQERVEIYQIKIGRTFEINAQVLQEIKANTEDSNEIKIMNLLKSIRKEAEEGQDENPILISIRVKAENILERFKNGQEKTARLLDETMELSEQMLRSKAEQKKSGLEPEVFHICWTLCQDGLEPAAATAIAKEINNSFEKFPYFAGNTEEERQLKIDIYRILMPLMDGSAVVKLAENLIETRRKMRESR